MDRQRVYVEKGKGEHNERKGVMAYSAVFTRPLQSC